ncbi:MAG TPA: CHRD domain-containing protein [Thermoleophilaceae bacterium]|nr:CHRD domain-containing protein [Thermoleophilaceae bacterium]
MRARTIVAIAVAVLVAVLAAGAIAVGKPFGDHGTKPNLEKRVLFAVLSGRNEVGPNGQRGAGDPNGRGSFTALVKGSKLCFGITVKNIDHPTAAHIHRGRPNQNGPIVVPLTPPSTGNPGASSGCVTVDPALARAILSHPHRYYANVHTTAFPNGAVRGQLFARSR